MQIKLRAMQLVAFVAFALTFMTAPAHAATGLAVANGTNAPVDVWINSTNPKVTHYVATINGAATTIQIPSTFGGDKGVFSLPVGATAVLTTNNNKTVMNGTITFNAIPVCPCGGAGQPPCPVVPNFPLPSALVNGVNQAEFALNTANSFESIDISCVNGANSTIVMKCEGGNPQWVNNVTKAPVRQFGNGPVDVAKGKDANCTQVGVFSYNTTNCINIAPPVPCQPPHSFCVHPTADCQLDRQGSGGLVTISVTNIN